MNLPSLCWSCDYWMPLPDRQSDPKAPLGFCDLFNKRTSPDHGAQCTAWVKREVVAEGGGK